jgi:glucosamine--fructose-6-phosphate aminotransferase (isomerizing)
MCGIIAGISENITKSLLDGLCQLQNRGYDSAGISLFNNASHEINTYKKASTKNISALEYLQTINTDKSNNQQSKLGIGHTRWATHGAKTDYNSHPHTSYDNKFVLVHNGIIENYKEIINYLNRHNIYNITETDTECIVNLLAFNYSQTNDVEKSIRATISELQGTWGLAIICIDTPNKLYCTRKGSPILVGHSDQCALVTSEQSGFCGKIQDYFILKNKDICSIEYHEDSNKISIKTCEASYLKKKVIINNSELTPAPYKHWMLKEINEQIDSIKRVIKQGSRLLDNDKVHLGGLNDNIETLKYIDHIILLGCGTSLNAAKFAIHYFKSLCSFMSVSFCDGADFTDDDISDHGSTALILLSQSGETKDLHRCIEVANNHNLFTIGVVNVVDSLIAREVDCGCYLHAGREVAVASTKSFTSQCILLVMIAIWFSQVQEPRVKKSLQRKRIIQDIRNLSNDIAKTLECHNSLKRITDGFYKHNSCFVLGKGKSESIAHEGALKIKEISYIHAEGYSTSSLKHGPFALLYENYPVIMISIDDEHYSKTQNAYEEVKSRGANIITITNMANMANKSEQPNTIVVANNKTFSSLLAIIPIQLLSYELALSKEFNPDQPRNLAKVVTVE